MKNKNDNVSYLPKWLSSGRDIKPEQSIIYRALKEYLNRVNQDYAEAESQSLATKTALAEPQDDPLDKT